MIIFALISKCIKTVEHGINKIFTLLLLLGAGMLFSQEKIKLTILDKNTQLPLRFCNVSIKGTYIGGITNEDGKINISSNSPQDTILISYLGYRSQTLPISQLKQQRTILLTPSLLSLNEVYVSPDDSYLYDILKACRKTILRNNTKLKSKVYFCLESQSKNKPLEFWECYFNGNHTGNRVDELQFKNGRMAVSTIDSSYFVSLNIEKLIYETDLTKNIGRLPYLPLQLKSNRMKTMFQLKMIGVYKGMYHIAFEARSNKYECFSGELWIDRKNANLLKIHYQTDNTSLSGFSPVSESDSLKDVSFSVTNAYQTVEGHTALHYINFSYQFTYKRAADTSCPAPIRISELIRPISTKSTIYFYDYGQAFILPYFNFSEYTSNFSKIHFIPYNTLFWEENNQLILSQEQKKNIGIFEQSNALRNFTIGAVMEHSQFRFAPYKLTNKDPNAVSLAFWFPNKRIHLPRGRQTYDNFKQYPPEIINQSFKRDLYHLEVQILLDITRLKDALFSRSFTIFDSRKSYYHLPKGLYTNVFFNLFFDICEIERRTMQTQLNQAALTHKAIETIYKNTLKNMENITQRYISEVDAGKNITALKYWNNYVLKHLKIDNIALAEAKERTQTQQEREAIKKRFEDY